MAQIARHPVMVPYTAGLKRLDNIYLDTSWGGLASGKQLVSKVCGLRPAAARC